MPRRVVMMSERRQNFVSGCCDVTQRDGQSHAARGAALYKPGLGRFGCSPKLSETLCLLESECMKARDG